MTAQPSFLEVRDVRKHYGAIKAEINSDVQNLDPLASSLPVYLIRHRQAGARIIRQQDLQIRPRGEDR